MLVLFSLLLLAAAQDGPSYNDVSLGTNYTGAIGDNQPLLRFFPNSFNATDLFVVELLPLSRKSNSMVKSMQLVVQDSRSRLFASLEAPVLDAGKVASDSATHLLCNTDSTDYYVLIPVGRPGVKYQITVNALAHKLALDTPVTKIPSRRGSPEWFYYDSDQEELPFFVHVDSPSSDISHLFVDCPTDQLVLNAAATTGFGQLTWATQATMTISRAVKPYISRGRWFIGIQTENATSVKESTLTISLGKTYESYMLPMILPSVGILLVIAVMLGAAVMTTCILSKKVEAKNTDYFATLPNSNVVQKSAYYLPYSWGYFLITLTVGVVFLIPGFQVVLEELEKMELTGDRDLCYYNEACQRPSGAGVPWIAMNNVVSNIGYIIVGLGFILYSYIVKWQSKKNRINVGVPRDGSIPYAMGIAIMLEGVASGVYHLCPSRIIFQFDTANMFIIAALGQAELFRRLFYHPSKSSIFMLIAALLFMNYIGSLTDADKSSNRIYNTIFFFFIISAFFLFFLFPFSLKGPDQKYFHFWGELTGSSEFRSKLSRPRIGFIAMLYAVNSAIFLYINLGSSEADFATTFLGMLVVTQTLSVLAYEFNNRRHLTKAPPLYIAMKAILTILFIAAWAVAIYFFIQPSSNKVLPAWESRDLNSDCYLADFYDVHDVWHFASAIALLIMCLIFFHLDLNAHYKGKNIGERYRQDYHYHVVDQEAPVNVEISQDELLEYNKEDW